MGIPDVVYEHGGKKKSDDSKKDSMKRRLVSMLGAASLVAQTPDADEIMRRVSENVGRATAARAAWVYDQEIFVRLKRANGKLAREESRQYTVAPTGKGAERELVKVEGKILEGKKEIAYDRAGYRQKDADVDGGLVNTFAREILWRADSRVRWRTGFLWIGEIWTSICSDAKGKSGTTITMCAGSRFERKWMTGKAKYWWSEMNFSPCW